MKAPARRFLVWNCYDCNWVGNRPEVHKDVQYHSEEPWDEYVCPECGESAGAEFWVQEDARWATPK